MMNSWKDRERMTEMDKSEKEDKLSGQKRQSWTIE